MNKLFLSQNLRESDLRSFANNLTEIFAEYSLTPHFLCDTRDIWLRDFLPIQIGSNQFAQFVLTRDYYPKKDRHKQTDPTPICKSLGIDPSPILYNGVPVYLDGGNVIRGFGKAIITEKVFKDNAIPKAILTDILMNALKVEQIIIIPKEPYDQAGHSDGMVRFVDEHTVVANDYRKIDVSNGFRDRFYGALSKAGLDVLPVPYHPADLKVDGLWVALGCYINFLQVGEKIFLPTFDDPVNDEAAIQRFGEILGEANIIPVPSRDVAMGGGVLNCLSWEIE